MAFYDGQYPWLYAIINGSSLLWTSSNDCLKYVYNY